MGYRGWAGTLGVTGVLAVFGGGLPLVDLAIAGDRALPPQAVLHVGQAGRAGGRPVSFTAAPGWVLRSGDSDLSSNVTLSKGPTVFALNVVSLSRDRGGAYPTVRELWQGLARLVPLQHDARLGGESVPVTTRQGVVGLTGGLTGSGQVGSASVVAVDDVAAEAVSQGPSAVYADTMDQVRAMVRSISFTRFHNGTRP